MFPRDVRAVSMNFPLRKHRYALRAAASALAAGEQGRYWEFHDALFENYNRLGEAKIKEIASGLRLDMEAFEKDARSKKVSDLITRDMDEARKAGVRGTPAVYVNGTLLKDRSPEGFRRAIESELRRLKEQASSD